MNRHERFVKELARFLVDDQVGKGIALSRPPGLICWAQEWLSLRGATPLFGYPTVEEAEKQLRDFLWPVPGGRTPNGDAK